MVLPLSQIELGETVKIVWIASEKAMATRLEDLGFIPGEEISCVLKGRKGGMRAFLVRNAVIGLREEHINEIFVQTDPAQCPLTN